MKKASFYSRYITRMIAEGDTNLPFVPIWWADVQIKSKIGVRESTTSLVSVNEKGLRFFSAVFATVLNISTTVLHLNFCLLRCDLTHSGTRHQVVREFPSAMKGGFQINPVQGDGEQFCTISQMDWSLDYSLLLRDKRQNSRRYSESWLAKSSLPIAFYH